MGGQHQGSLWEGDDPVAGSSRGAWCFHSSPPVVLGRIPRTLMGSIERAQPKGAALTLPCKVITYRNDKLLTNYTISFLPDTTNEISMSCFQLIQLLRK